MAKVRLELTEFLAGLLQPKPEQRSQPSPSPQLLARRRRVGPEKNDPNPLLQLASSILAENRMSFCNCDWQWLGVTCLPHCCFELQPRLTNASQPRR